MNMTQKTICIVRCDKTTLPILDYIDSRSLVALSLSRGVILWVYKGLAMLIPPERIANITRINKSVWVYGENDGEKGLKRELMTFTSDDTIKLPSKIARALLGDE